MASIAKLHLEFKRRANRLNSQHRQDLLPWQIDAILNDAQHFYVEHFAGANRLPFEYSQVRFDMLSTLVVGYPEQPDLTASEIEDGKYEVSLNNLALPYLHLARAYAMCGDKPKRISFKRHDELGDILRSTFHKPSDAWGRYIGTFSRSSAGTGQQALIIYAETDPSPIRLEYIKRPEKVFLGGYDSIEYLECVENGQTNCGNFYSSSDNPVTSELPEQYAENLLVDIAVYLHYGQTDNPQLMQIAKEKITLTT